MRRLQHVTKRGVQPKLRSFLGIPAVDQHSALGGVVEAANQVDKRRLARARLTHDGNRGAARHVQIEILQHPLVSVGVHKRYVVKINVSVQRLPIFTLGIEGVAVFFDHLGAVRHVGLGFQYLGYALNVDTDEDHVRHGVDHPLHLLHHIHGIRHEYRQLAKEDNVALRDQTASPQHQSKCERGGKRDQADKACTHACSQHGGFAHFTRQREEAIAHFLLRAQHAHGARAGNALVKLTRNLRVELSDLAVESAQLALKQRRAQRDDGNDDHDAKRQLPVQNQHDNRRADQIGQIPYAAHKVPCNDAADTAGVTHDARVHVAHAVLVKEREGQRLQMLEYHAAQVSCDQGLHTRGLEGRDKVRRHARQEKQRVEYAENAQSVQGFGFDKVFNGVFLEQRQGDVHKSAVKAEDQHDAEHPQIRLEDREHLGIRQALALFALYAIGIFYIFRFHACTSPSSLPCIAQTRL